MRSATFRAAAAAMLALAVAASPTTASAALERVGPIVSSHGYPLWFQDGTGVVFDFCTPTLQFELDQGLCLLLPGDTVVPESFPNQFFDEHFYWSAGSDPTLQWFLPGTQGGRVILVLALEGAFGTGNPVPGAQIVFGRLRIRLDDVPLTGDYTFYTPYGKYVIAGTAGGRIFFTEDIGLGCTAPDFTCALSSSIGPYLLPSDTPGGPDLPPVTFPQTPGRLYVADPARVDNVTGGVCRPASACDANGDYITSDGPKNPNIFRIEGPGGVFMGESTAFSLQGRLFSGEIAGRVTTDRASYARTAASQQVDVFATAFPTRNARIPGTPVVPPVSPSLRVYPVPCAGTLAADGVTLLPPFAAPVSAATSLRQNGTVHFAQLRPAAIPTHVCVEHANARNASGQLQPVFFNVPVTDQVNITEATYDPDAQTLLVTANSSDAVAPPPLTVAAIGETPATAIPAAGTVTIATPAPPSKVFVSSFQGGTNTLQVTVTAGTGVANAAPEANDDSVNAIAFVPTTFDVLANDRDPDGDALRIVGVTQPSAGTVSIAGGLTLTYTAPAGFAGQTAFAYTITDDRGGFATANVFVGVNLGPNIPPDAVPDLATTLFQTPVTVNVLANDSDQNGDPLAVVAVAQPTTGGIVTFTPSSVTFVPATGFTGTTTFTYTVRDTRGGQTTALVTVTVRPAETLTFTLAQFRQGTGEWRLSGAGSIDGSVITLRASADLTGPVIGTATVAGGLWTFRGTGVPFSTRVSASSSNGGVRLNQPVTLR